MVTEGGRLSVSNNNRARASIKRKMRADRTTRLLIVILSLFLLSEFPQVRVEENRNAIPNPITDDGSSLSTKYLMLHA